ncbi:MarR family winged helix-turn-helix transcriptional regulator [Hasllibacter sp. MH4015]|uniref:MarR family winged helix-turn-helix transcriptional regulator n=1 Tax=Hasllibacter sp. MH4015 TaxID=2854029 RepID=UPI001CD7E366|nr:MarR family transcriptional regulator [Hasllibacter sp. MH4015]
MPEAAEILQVIHRLSHRAWAKEGAAIGLSHSEFEYLAAIHAEAQTQFWDGDTHGQHLHNIVDRLGVSKASASAMVSKLEGRALITRIQCQMDARAQHIILTDAGADLLRRGEEIYDAIARTLPDQIAAEVAALTAP